MYVYIHVYMYVHVYLCLYVYIFTYKLYTDKVWNTNIYLLLLVINLHKHVFFAHIRNVDSPWLIMIIHD